MICYYTKDMSICELKCENKKNLSKIFLKGMSEYYVIQNKHFEFVQISCTVESFKFEAANFRGL